jgi:hypothetical protein
VFFEIRVYTALPPMHDPLREFDRNLKSNHDISSFSRRLRSQISAEKFHRRFDRELGPSVTAETLAAAMSIGDGSYHGTI